MVCVCTDVANVNHPSIPAPPWNQVGTSTTGTTTTATTAEVKLLRHERGSTSFGGASALSVLADGRFQWNCRRWRCRCRCGCCS